jgi:hypothetical protein
MAEYDINGTIFYHLALRHARSGALKMPWAAAWESLITAPPGLSERDDLVWRERLKNSRQLARSGVVQALAVRPGRVSARVEDPLTKIVHAIKIIVPVAQNDVWDAIADRAGATLESAARMAGGVPEPSWIEPLLARRSDVTFEADGKLLPASEAPQPLPAAAWLVFAERLEADPWLWVLFRGQTRDGLLDRMEALRQARIAQQTVSAPSGNAPGEGLTMDHFWTMDVLPEEQSPQEDAWLTNRLRSEPCGIHIGKRRLSRMLAGVISGSLRSKP